MTGFIGGITISKPNQSKSRHYFTVYFKDDVTSIVKVIVTDSEIQALKRKRDQFNNRFRDQLPITLKSIMKGRDAFFFNAYSSIQAAVSVAFDINEANAIPLKDLNDDGLVLSIVGKCKLTSPIVNQQFFRNGKNKVERMREVLISDGTRSLPITFWGDLVDLLRDNVLIQIVNANTKILHDSIVLNTTYTTGICFLSAELKVTFDEETVVKTHSDIEPTMRLCCPSIESIVLDTFFKCKKCAKKIKLVPGTGILTCTHCHREYLVSNLQKDIACKELIISFDLKTSDRAITASAFVETLNEYFGKDVRNDEKNHLKTQILGMQNVDFIIKKSNMVITEIISHDE